MHKWIVLMALSVAGLACNTGGGKKAASVNPACEGGTVDVAKISGVWIKQVLHNDGRKEQFPEFRLSVSGASAKYVAGINVFDMDTKVSGTDKLTLAQKVSPADLANFKKHNKDPNMGLRRLVDVRPKARGCKVEVSERYETYVDGKRMEQRTESAQYTMVPYTGGPAMSFEVCTDARAIKLGKGSQDNAAVAGKPVQVTSQGTTKDLKGEGCKPFSDLFISGKLVMKGVEGRVDGDKVYREVEASFPEPKANANAVFVEMFRYADCGGTKKLASVACNAVPVL